jgi:hypothetical protein
MLDQSSQSRFVWTDSALSPQYLNQTKVLIPMNEDSLDSLD